MWIAVAAAITVIGTIVAACLKRRWDMRDREYEAFLYWIRSSRDARECREKWRAYYGDE